MATVCSAPSLAMVAEGGMAAAALLMESTVRAGASRQVAAAVSSALWRLLVGCSAYTSTDYDVNGLVADRLALIKPVLTAQVQHGLATGTSRHTAKGLIGDAQMCQANAARHLAFESQVPLSSWPLRDVKRRQRGGMLRG